MSDLGELNVPYRLLLGPGPSLVHPRVYRAMTAPVIGYMDPVFIQLIDDTQRPLRTLFRTENDMTMAVSGTGTCGRCDRRFRGGRLAPHYSSKRRAKA